MLRWCLVTLLFLTTSAQIIERDSIGGGVIREPNIQGGAGEVEITFLEIILEAQVENVQHFYKEFSKNDTDSEEISGGKCGRIKQVYCGVHGLYLLHDIYRMCKKDVSCWIDELKKIKNDEERSGNCWSDCYNYICKKIKNTLVKFFKLVNVYKDLNAIDCPDNPNQE